ncbi:MAG: MFS transporter [Cyanobacteria bacterium]|nr:MFS transporter [Cyanobacteriota bacterium]MDA0866862.1 MFS transporter [Cyanobacteriota bacterium]
MKSLLLWRLGLAHGVADGATGWLMGDLLLTQDPVQGAIALLLYNGIAFGGQALTGLVVDRTNTARLAAWGGLGLLALGLGVAHGSPWMAVLLAGLGSAWFHPGAGAIATHWAKGQAAPLGIFTAPGVLGLGLGLGWALTDHGNILPGLALGIGWIGLGILPPLAASLNREPPTCAPRSGMTVLLLGAIFLRSGLWLALQGRYYPHLGMLLALTGAAAGGKWLGGYLGDCWGWRNWAIAATLGAIALGVSPHWQLHILGAMLLQSTVPITWAAINKTLPPDQTATATGLALGLAIALSGIWLLPAINLATVNW